ncbi:MAG: glycosyltransferase family 4 protein [Bacteroidota bacterium]
MKILFLTDNFPPEVNAPANRTYEHCREWVQKGVKVTIITCAPNFPQGKVYKGYKNKFYQTEVIDEIKVIRVWSYIAANEGFLKRTFDFMSFGIMSFFIGLFIKTDLIIATSPQFFTPIAGRCLAFFKRKPWIMEVRDLWPESIKAVGAMSANSLSYKFLEALELAMYKSARQIIVVTDAFKKYIKERKISESKIIVIKNGVDLTKISSTKNKNVKLVKQLNLEGKFVVGYIGTHGMAHKLDFVLNSASSDKLDKDICFLFIGDGAEKKRLLALQSKLKLENVIMCDPVPKSEVYEYISILDVALVNLKKSDTFKTVIPSKIFENSAMKKPILLGVEGESKGIIEKYRAGVCFEPENEADFIQKLQLLKQDQILYQQCVLGCENLVKDFDRVALARKMLDAINIYTEEYFSQSDIKSI